MIFCFEIDIMSLNLSFCIIKRVQIKYMKTYVFVGDAHKVAVKANMLVSDVHPSLVSDLANDVAEPSEHFVCALL